MIVTTTPTVEGRPVKDYLGVVVTEPFHEASVMLGSDDAAGVVRARELALKVLEERAQAKGANALVGVSLDCEWTGNSTHRYSVGAMGTAVFIP